MTIRYKYNSFIIIQIFLIVAFCTPLLAFYMHGFVYFVPSLAGFFILFASTESYAPVFIKVIRSLRMNLVLFVMLIWYIIGIIFSHLRYAENTQFLLGSLLIPIFFFYGLFVNSTPKYHYFTVTLVVLCYFLNTLLTGGEISKDFSAKDVLDRAGSLANPIGSSGYWGSIGIFFPIFLANYKNIKKKYARFGYIITLVFLVYKLIFSGFATPLGLLTLNLITIATLYLICHLKSLKQLVGALILFLITIIGIYFFVNWLKTSELFGIKQIQWRLLNIMTDPSSGGYSRHYISRYDLFFISVETFMRYPLFGSGADIMTMANVPLEIRCGGHSSLIDGLAVLGSLGGGGAICYFFYKSLKTTIDKFKKTRSFEDLCHTSVVFTLIIGGILNPYWMGSILILFLLLTHIYQITS